jgi:tRNA-splicing ligase RtcB
MRVITSEKIPIKLWLEEIEETALKQAKNLANLPHAYSWVAVMPDAHPGYGMPIGGVLATEGIIVPNAVGVDIGCGLRAVKTSLTQIDQATLKAIMSEIGKTVPVGFRHHREPQEWIGFREAPDLKIIQQELGSARRQLGTLGGGNHFIEILKGNDGFIWLMLHSGSRNFGLKTAAFYHQKAKELSYRWAKDLPDRDLAFLPLESRPGQEYFTAMNYCLRFAKANRELMMKRLEDIVIRLTQAVMLERIDIHHNYAALEKHFDQQVLIHRKGATLASQGLTGIIPGSMGTASFIVEGLGNPESFTSCSHGAGRQMGRNEARRVLSLAQEQQKMAGIIHCLQTVRDLDEAPGAYKDIAEVMQQQKDLVKIKVRLFPLAVIKG